MKLFANFSLRQLLYNKRFTIPLSIILAFFVWLSITIIQRPIMDRTFSDMTVSINIENTFVSENSMNIVNNLSEQKFTVAVRGPSYSVSSLTASDFYLYASAAEVDAPGEYNLKVMANKNSADAEYEILSISPANINVSFDYIDTKDFIIEAAAVGATAESGLIAENGVVGGIENDTVTISGPRGVINKIERVVALAEVNKTLSVSETFDAVIKLYDEQGEEIEPENLTVSATSVKVTVPISKKKKVPVKVAFSNVPIGFDVSTLKTAVDNTEVTIIGTPETIDKTSEITLSPIDLTTVSPSSKSFDVAAKLPEGVRLLDSLDHFTVTIDTTGYIEKTITVSTFKYRGVSQGLSAGGATALKTVKVCGPRAVINKLNQKAAYAEVNLTDKKAGAHTVICAISFTDYNNIWAVGSYTTTVTIK